MASILKKLEGLGHRIFYLVLQLLGHRAALVLLRGVIGCYVLFSKKIHHTTGHYLSRRFPGQSGLTRWLNTYRNVLSFGQVLVERGWLGMSGNGRLQGTFIGYKKLIGLIDEGKGVILLTGHVGNWQSVLAHLSDLPVPVNALMQYDNEAAAKHYFDLKKKGRRFNLIDAEGEFGGMVDAIGALQRGEIVSIMGDRYIKGSSSTVRFFGDDVRVPDSAYLLAASAGAPVAVVFAAKTGIDTFALRLWDYFYPEYGTRSERGSMMQECSARYFRALEGYLGEYPYQWYNFYDFWKQ
jgi:predicted LPLAT superfamily acyltransferase